MEAPTATSAIEILEPAIEILGPITFEELWNGTGGEGPAGFASAEFRKLSKADLCTIGNILRQEGRIDTGGMWLGTWLRGRHYEHGALRGARTGEGFSARAVRKAREAREARERAARSDGAGEGFAGWAFRKAKERAAGMRTEGFFSRGRGETFAERAAKEREREARMQARRRRDIDEWKMRIAAGGYKSGRNWCDDPSIYAEAQRELEAEKANA